MNIGERIKQRRLELGLSQDEVAKKCGYKSRSSVQKLENSRELPLKKVSLMARALECSETYLMGWSNPDYTVDTAAGPVIIESIPQNLAKISRDRLLLEYAVKLYYLDNSQKDIIYNMIDALTQQSNSTHVS